MAVAIFAALLTQIIFGEIEKSKTLLDSLPLWIAVLAAILSMIKTRSIGWGMGLGFVVYLVGCLVLLGF